MRVLLVITPSLSLLGRGEKGHHAFLLAVLMRLIVVRSVTTIMVIPLLFGHFFSLLFFKCIHLADKLGLFVFRGHVSV